MRIFTCTAVVLAAFALAACGEDDDDVGDDAGRIVSIDQALASDSEEPLLVSGNLLAQTDELRLCSALAESFPPQCGGASLAVLGLDLEAVDGLVTHGDVSWTDRPIQLLGIVSHGILTVSENATE